MTSAGSDLGEKSRGRFLSVNIDGDHTDLAEQQKASDAKELQKASDVR